MADPFRGVIDLITMELVTFPPKDEVLGGEAAAVEPMRSSVPAEFEAEATGGGSNLFQLCSTILMS